MTVIGNNVVSHELSRHEDKKCKRVILGKKKTKKEEGGGEGWKKEQETLIDGLNLQVSYDA